MAKHSCILNHCALFWNIHATIQSLIPDLAYHVCFTQEHGHFRQTRRKTIQSCAFFAVTLKGHAPYLSKGWRGDKFLEA